MWFVHSFAGRNKMDGWMEATEDPDVLWETVESVILADRRTKEDGPS
jgi:hypothetical protein